jgi:hypothetical protein
MTVALSLSKGASKGSAMLISALRQAQGYGIIAQTDQSPRTITPAASGTTILPVVAIGPVAAPGHIGQRHTYLPPPM